MNEMRPQILTPAHLDRLPVQAVVYEPQNFRTVAIQITAETIGAMAIEFGYEIQITHPSHRWLRGLLDRVNEKGEHRVLERILQLDDWLVVLEDEIHVFPGDVFWNTFGQAKLNIHVAAVEPVEPTGFERTSGFMDLGPGFVSPQDPNYQQNLPELPA